MPKEKLTDRYIKSIPNPNKQKEIYDTVVDGLAIRISKTGKKSFVFRFFYDGKSKRYTIGRYPEWSLANARKEAKELKMQVGRGNDPIKERSRKIEANHKNTFADLIEQYNRAELSTLKPKTREERERIINRYLMPKFRNQQLNDISKSQVLELLDTIAIDRKAPTMANRVRTALYRLFNFAIERDMTHHNPVQTIPKRSEGENQRERYYTTEEIESLWQAFDNLDEPTRSLFKILLITGQRKTETSKMRWKDIGDDIWSIPSFDAKNGKPHDVPLSPLAIEVIEELRPWTGENTYVFESPNKPNNPIQIIKRSVKKVRNYSNVPDFRIHDVRRTVATHLAKLNVERTTLGKILNHKGLAGDTQVTAIYDRHSYMDEKREALNRWSQRLQKIIAGEADAKIYKIG